MWSEDITEQFSRVWFLVLYNLFGVLDNILGTSEVFFLYNTVRTKRDLANRGPNMESEGNRLCDQSALVMAHGQCMGFK